MKPNEVDGRTVNSKALNFPSLLSSILDKKILHAQTIKCGTSSHYRPENQAWWGDCLEKSVRGA